MRLALASASVLAVTLAASTQAADSLALAGASDSSLGSYGYIGVMMPLGDSALGRGWILRQWVDRITYRYDGVVPNIHAEAYGYAPAISYQWALGDGTNHAALSGGLRVTHTDLSFDDPGNPNRGTHVRFSLQAELASSLSTHAENQFLAQGEFGSGAYYVRDRLAMRFAYHYTLGPEATLQGSHEYRARGAALCLGGIALTRHTRLLLRAGIYQQRDRPTAATGGLELAASF
jgi:hypothetical protein